MGDFIVRCMQVVAIFLCLVFIDHENSAQQAENRRGGADLRRIGYASGISMGLENGAFNALVLFAGFSARRWSRRMLL